jgi:hypothetical protein
VEKPEYPEENHCRGSTYLAFITLQLVSGIKETLSAKDLTKGKEKLVKILSNTLPQPKDIIWLNNALYHRV